MIASGGRLERQPREKRGEPRGPRGGGDVLLKIPPEDEIRIRPHARDALHGGCHARGVRGRGANDDVEIVI